MWHIRIYYTLFQACDLLNKLYCWPFSGCGLIKSKIQHYFHNCIHHKHSNRDVCVVLQQHSTIVWPQGSVHDIHVRKLIVWLLLHIHVHAIVLDPLLCLWITNWITEFSSLDYACPLLYPIHVSFLHTHTCTCTCILSLNRTVKVQTLTTYELTVQQGRE